MKWLTILALVVLSLLSIGCTSTRLPEGRHSFSFTFDGADYEIIGTDPTGGDGTNLLVMREGGHVVLRAVDLDQDGTIDSVLAGNVSVSRANEAYASGIAAAKSQGRYSVQTPTRLVEFDRPEGMYTLQSNMFAAGTPSNRFALLSARSERSFVALDSDADGVLDRVQQGGIELHEAQEVYETVLRDAERIGRVEKIGGRYVVTPAGRARA